MSEVFNCSFARVILWETKVAALKNIKKNPGEVQYVFNTRIKEERFRLFSEKFENLPKFQLEKGRQFIYTPFST